MQSSEKRRPRTETEKKKAYLNLLFREPYKIGHFVGFKDLTPLHNAWLRSFLWSTEDQTLLAHRGSYKTTTLQLFLAIYAIIRPNENIILFRKTDGDTAEVIRGVYKILTSGAMQTIAAAIYSRPLSVQPTAGSITTGYQTRTTGAPQIVGLGIGTSITGKHGDIIITDDIVNIADRYSRAERERTTRAYEELQNIRNRGGRIINTGTPWHREDCIATHMTKAGKVQKFDCYHTGLITADKLRELRASMSPALFAANYELRHIADEDALFTSPIYETRGPEAIRDGIAHIDAAYGGSDGTAFTIMKGQPDGTITAYGRLWRGRHVLDCIEELRALHTGYRAGSIYTEDNGDKGFGAEALRAAGLPTAAPYHENQNKYLKIASYLRRYWQDIHWLPETDPDYMREILDYTEHAEHDDAPDSAASLLRILKERPAAITGAFLRGGL